MPSVPTFDATPDIHAVEQPQASPGAMGAIGAGIAEGAGAVEGPLQEFNRRYQEARMTTDASKLAAANTQRLGDLEITASKIPDRQKAQDAYKTGADAIRQDIDKIDNPFVRMMVSHMFEEESASRYVSTSQRAFEREAQQNTADLTAAELVYRHQRALAFQNGNMTLVKTLDDRATRAVEANRDLGYMLPTEAEVMLKGYKSGVLSDEIEHEANAARMALNDKKLDEIAARVSNEANYGDLLENDREALTTKLTTWSWKVASKRSEIAAKNAAAGVRVLQDNMYAMRLGLEPPHPMNDAAYASAASAAGLDPHLVLDQVHHMQIYNQATQATALTSVDDDLRMLEALRDPKKGVAMAAPGTPAFKIMKLEIANNEARFRDTKAAVDAKLAQLKADPVGYLMGNSPEIANAFQIAAKDPKQLKHALDLATSQLTRMHVGEQFSAVLPLSQARGLAYELQRNPSQAPATLATLQHNLGPTYYGRVMRDLSRLGGLPAMYQAIGAFDDHEAGAVVGKFIEGMRPDPTTGKVKIDSELVSSGDRTKIRDSIANDPRMKSLFSSMLQQGASIPYATEYQEAVVALAYSRKLNGGESVQQAVQGAITSFLGRTRFLDHTGSARAPVDQFDATVASSEGVLQRLDLNNIQLPRRANGAEIYGTKPGLTPPQEYLDAVNAKPFWVQSENGTWWYLKDWANRYVKDKNGNKVGVPVGGRPDLLPKQEPTRRVEGEQVPTTAAEAAGTLLLRQTEGGP